jgi:hypothetical protein
MERIAIVPATDREHTLPMRCFKMVDGLEPIVNAKALGMAEP